MPPPNNRTNPNADEASSEIPMRGSANSPEKDAVPIAAPNSCNIRAGV